MATLVMVGLTLVMVGRSNQCRQGLVVQGCRSHVHGARVQAEASAMLPRLNTLSTDCAVPQVGVLIVRPCCLWEASCTSVLGHVLAVRTC